MPRNTSINQHYISLGQQHTPAHRFAGSTQNDWRQWYEALHPAVIETLGTMPQSVDPNPEIEIEWREDGLMKQRILFDVEPGLAAQAYIFRPEDAQGQLPAILCCHGHGPHGKEAVMGNRSSTVLRESIEKHNYAYGLEMAKAGFVTMAIDFRGFGARDDRNRPHNHDVTYGRDICNVHFLRAAVLGRTLLGQDVHDAQRALDLLCDQDFVDPERLGVMGLSFGGTMTTWITLADRRIKASDIICYSDRFANFGMRDVNFCGSQITPGLFALCDVPDLHGLIAPQPLLVEIGIHDQCFRVESATSCYREVERIYQAAGASDKLELDLFPDEHKWGANRSVPFFRRYL